MKKIYNNLNIWQKWGVRLGVLLTFCGILTWTGNYAMKGLDSYVKSQNIKAATTQTIDWSKGAEVKIERNTLIITDMNKKIDMINTEQINQGKAISRIEGLLRSSNAYPTGPRVAYKE